MNRKTTTGVFLAVLMTAPAARAQTRGTGAEVCVTVNAYSSAPPSNGAFAGSMLKLEGLHFMNPTANATAYLGGGFSYGGTTFGSYWHGSGLQGELTVGYELPRASTLRVFVQADAVFLFYKAQSQTFSSKSGWTTAHRCAPSLGISVGLGRARR